MTTKEAAKKFNLEEGEIRKRRKDEMILDAHKEGRYIVIPDETEIIPSKKSIQSFLLQILKNRNSGNYTFSRSLCPTDRELRVLLDYLYRRGLIGCYDTENPERALCEEISLTEEGIEYIFGEKKYQALNVTIPLNINLSLVSASAQLACVGL